MLSFARPRFLLVFPLVWIAGGGHPVLTAVLTPGSSPTVTQRSSSGLPARHTLLSSSSSLSLSSCSLIPLAHALLAPYLAQLVIRFLCAQPAPLFATDGHRTPFPLSLADSVLRDSLVRVHPHASVVTRYSLHSVRMGLACAFLACGASRAEIMPPLRGPSMPTINARPNPATTMSSLDRTLSVSSTAAVNLPRVDSDHAAVAACRRFWPRFSPSSRLGLLRF